MPKVHKTITEARKHLEDSTAVIPARYEAGTAKADWEGRAASPEAEANFVEGINEAISAGSRVTGIAKAGNAKFQKGCKEKGKGVIAQRIKAAAGDYEREFRPVHEAMCSAADAAPARTRDFRANINNRLLPVVEAARRAVGKE